MTEILKILKTYKLNKKLFFYLIFFTISSQLLIVSIPIVTSKITGVLEFKWDLKDFYFWCYILIIVSIFLCISFFMEVFFREYLWLKTWTELMKSSRKKLFEKDYKTIIEVWTWKLISRLARWIDAQTDIFTALVSIFFNAGLRIILLVIVFFFTSPLFAWIIIFWAIFLWIVVYFTRKYAEKYQKEEVELWEKSSRVEAKLIMNNLDLRILWKEKKELELSDEVLSKLPNVARKADIPRNVQWNLLELITRIIVFFIYFVFGLQILKWEQSIANMTLIIMSLWTLYHPLNKAMDEIWRISRVWDKYMKLQKFLDTEIEIKNWAKVFEYKKWEIKFENVDFFYNNDRKIFENLNLKIKSWQKNAFVWHSWWGKSTITKLILRLYEISSWKLLVDWQNIKDIKIETFYNNIAYLSQEPAVFDWTIRENMEYALSQNSQSSPLDLTPTLSFGGEGEREKSVIIPFVEIDKNVEVFGKNISKDDEQEKQIWEALKKAKMDDLVKSLPKWLDTEIWEKWIKLSWWEKQRLAIARVFLKNPKIIILDEPTSALDSISENHITESLNELLKWKTSIIIAHRLQTVINSDKIFVIENWKIESEWTHLELLKKSKIYKTLVDLQHWCLVE